MAKAVKKSVAATLRPAEANSPLNIASKIGIWILYLAVVEPVAFRLVLLRGDRSMTDAAGWLSHEAALAVVNSVET
jgi:hypothetical protein